MTGSESYPTKYPLKPGSYFAGIAYHRSRGFPRRTFPIGLSHSSHSVTIFFGSLPMLWKNLTQRRKGAKKNGHKFYM
jgi:hypothetical protein